MKVILFDFDGTIADSFAPVLKIANQLAIEYGYPVVQPEEIEHLQNLGSREIVRRSGVSLIQLPFLLMRLRRELNREIHHLQPFPDMKAALVALKKQGYMLGIATSNSRENVLAFLEAQSFTNLIDMIGTGLTLFGKDRVIQRTLKRHKLDPAIVIYVGDETRDIEAARKICIKIIAVSWGYSSSQVLAAQQPDRLIHHPNELIAAIESLSY